MTTAYQGAWVKRGLIKVPTIKDTRKPGKHGGPEPFTHEETAAMTLGILATFDLPQSHQNNGWLCQCGCLLIGDETRCYACSVWAQKDAVHHSWRLEELNNRKAHTNVA